MEDETPAAAVSPAAQPAADVTPPIPPTDQKALWLKSLEKEIVEEASRLLSDSAGMKSVAVRAFLGDLASRLTSRKFWIAVVSAAYFALHGDPTQATVVIATYFGVNWLDGIFTSD